MYHRQFCSALIKYSYRQMNSIYEAILRLLSSAFT